jgi:hypothetical protein
MNLNPDGHQDDELATTRSEREEVEWKKSLNKRSNARYLIGRLFVW